MSDFVFLRADLFGLAIAAPFAVALWFLPAALIGRALAHAAPQLKWPQLIPAIAFAFLPLIDAFLIRVAGAPFAACCHVVAALAALAFARPWIPRVRPLTLAAAAVWWIYLAVVYVDVDYRGGLHQSLLVLDLVKHAAVVREIAQHGLPLQDPFFLRAAPAGYYHYFYDGAALIDLLGGAVIDARMAFVGLTFACGIAFASLVRAFIIELGWQRVSDRRLTAGIVLLCSVGGLDLIGVWFRWQVAGLLERNSEWWDDEISLFTTSASWVPHHLAAVVASFTALLLLVRAHEQEYRKPLISLSMAAGISIASSFGLSVWVTVGAVCIFVLSVPVMAKRNPERWLSALACAGLVSGILSILQITQLFVGRQRTALPLGFWLRDPARVSELMGHHLDPWLAIALTPIIWTLEFGALAVGSNIFWRSQGFKTDTTLWRLLTCCMVAALAMNLFLKSTIINNDFGWRVAWFAAFPAMLMTLAVLQRPLDQLARQPILVASIGLGLAATIYNAVCARISPPGFAHSEAYINANPSMDYALAQAYRSASRTLPEDAVLQHNPTSEPRSLDFGLYGSHRTYVADGQAGLFGASPAEVAQRAGRIGKVFQGALPIGAARGLQLVVTRDDGLWRRLPPAECVYRSNAVCITKKVL